MPLVIRRNEDAVPDTDWQSIAAQYKATVDELIMLQARSSRERVRQEALIHHLIVQRDYLRATRNWWNRFCDFLTPHPAPYICDDALRDLIAQCALRVQNYDGLVGQQEAVRQLREYIKPNCHTEPRPPDANTLSPRIELEWFAGQLLLIVDVQDQRALATWLSLLPKYIKE